MIFCIGYFDGRLLVLMILFEALYEWRPLYLMSLFSEEIGLLWLGSLISGWFVGNYCVVGIVVCV